MPQACAQGIHRFVDALHQDFLSGINLRVRGSRTDDERVEDLKSWWRENGNSIIAGIVLIVTPLVAAITLWILVGASLAVMGVVQIVRAFTLKPAK